MAAKQDSATWLAWRAGPSRVGRRPRRPRRLARPPRSLLARAGISLGAATALVTALALSPPASPASAAAPTVSTGKASGITTTGALISASIDPEGRDTFYEVVYGPTGKPLSSTTGYYDAGAGTSTVVRYLAVDGLSPKTSYTYFVAAFVNATGSAYDASHLSFTTASVPTGPARPLVPPKNPPANGIFDGQCRTAGQCLSDINGVRAAQENLRPLSLPTNWSSLTAAEQMFVFTDMERVSRGESPVRDLVSTYNGIVRTGMLHDDDPSLAGVPGDSQALWSGGSPTVLGAMYGWVYDDGYGAGNLDCPQRGAPGCWSHRDGILADPADNYGTNPTEMSAVVGRDYRNQPSYAAVLVNPGTPIPPSSIVLSWAGEQRYLVPPPAASAH